MSVEDIGRTGISPGGGWGLEDHVVYPLPRSAQDLVQRPEDFPTLSGFPFP